MIRSVGTTRIPAFNAGAMRSARESKNWSQGRLAVALGLAVVTVSSWERGSSAPEPPKFVLLAAALDVSPADLLTTPAADWTLTDLRVVSGVHQKTAAAQLGIRPTRLSQIETGYEPLREPIRSDLAILYDVPIHAIDQAWERGRDRLLSET